MKIYIAGAISHDKDYEQKFGEAEERLKNEGHQVLNPAKNQGYTYRDYINAGLFQLMGCDAIYLLKGHANSKGARLEKHYAEACGLEIFEEE